MALQQEFEKALQNSPILAQRDQAGQEFISSMPRIRADIAELVKSQPLSPNQIGSIESSRRAASAVPLGSLNDLSQAYLTNLANAPTSSGKSGGFEDRMLTLNEAAEYGVPVGTMLSALMGQNVSKPLTATELKTQQAKQRVNELVARLKEYYYGEEGKQDDLSYGRFGGIAPSLQAALGQNPRVERYGALRRGAASALKEAVGETGVLTDRDISRIIGLIPTVRVSPETARLGFEDIDLLLGQNTGATTQNGSQIGRFVVEVE